jgi:hypothetical protein
LMLDKSTLAKAAEDAPKSAKESETFMSKGKGETQRS